MKKIFVLLITFILMSSVFAEIFPQDTQQFTAVESEIIPQSNQTVFRDVPDWNWQTTPQDLLTNYADYFQCYNATPVALQPDDHGGGLYIIYRVKNAAGSSAISYTYVDSEGNVLVSQGLGSVGYYSDADVDPSTGDVFGTWHVAVNDGSNTYDCIAIYDLYHILIGYGLWKDPVITVLNSDSQNSLDPTYNDEFIWPQIEIGSSPVQGKQRIYIVASNHNEADGNEANPSENVMIMYADFDENDLNIMSDLDWSYNTIPVLDDWNAGDPYWYRPFKSFTVIDNQLIFAGYRNASSYAPDQEDKLFCFVNDNYGEGDNWEYHYQEFELAEENPSWQYNGHTWYLYSDLSNYPNYPSTVYESIQQNLMNSGHFNLVPTHNNTAVTWAGVLGITFDSGNGPGYYYPLWFQTYPKTFTFNLITEEFSFCDVYPQGANPNDDEPMEPWDLDEDGDIDSFASDGMPEWFQDWPIFHYDEDAAFHYNQYYLTTNEENGWMAYIWVDGTMAKGANEGLEGYEDWIAKPELAISTSNDWGMTWNDPIFINANPESENYDPEFSGMIPCFAYPGDRIEDLGDNYGLLHLFFIDDNDYGSYHSQSHGLNSGSTFEYASIAINFGESTPVVYGDIDENDSVEAYDAALVLNYVVGNDPIPEIDPIPWEGWREERADVDLNDEIQAYDAALILHYVVGMIPELPWTQRQSPIASLNIERNNDYLNISADGEFYSATLSFDVDLSSAQITPMNEDIIYAVNGSKLAIASTQPLSGELLKIKISDIPDYITGFVNAREGMIEYGSNGEIVSAKINSIYPNPFNPETTISYQLAEDAAVKITVYNVKGQLVESLVDEKIPQGEHQIFWKADNQSSGIYFVKMNSLNYEDLHMIVLIK